MRASFGGSADFVPSVSTGAASVTVSRAPTTLGLLSSVNPTPTGQSATFTATVFPTTGSGETGVVSFFADGPGSARVRSINGQATLVVSTLSAGDHAITATYAGDGDFIGSASPAPLTQSVGPEPAGLSRGAYRADQDFRLRANGNPESRPRSEQ